MDPSLLLDAPQRNLFPARGPGSVEIGPSAVIFKVKDLYPNSENRDLCDRLAKSLLNLPPYEKNEEFVQLYLKHPEAGHVADELDGKEVAFLIFVHQFAKHGEQEWDVPGPFRLCALSHDGHVFLAALKVLPKREDDVHFRNAAKAFGVPIDQVSKEQRQFAKTVNFGAPSEKAMRENLRMIIQLAGASDEDPPSE